MATSIVNSVMTTIIATLALLTSFFQDTVKNTVPTKPMSPDFITATTAHMQFKGTLDCQRVFSPETVDAASIVAEICKLFAISSEETNTAAIAAVIDKLLFKGPQYITAGLSIPENGGEPVFYAAIQFRDTITPELITDINQAFEAFPFHAFGDNVIASATIKSHDAKIIPQTAILPEGAFFRLTADISTLDDPENALAELMDSPFPEFSSARYAAITFADTLTIEARFAEAAGAQAAAKIVSKTRKKLLKEFANYPIHNSEIRKITVKQMPVSNEDGHGAFSVNASITYDALNALLTAIGKKPDKFSEAVLGTPARSVENGRNSKAMTIKCQNNLKQLVLCLVLYASDNDDILPASSNWQQVLKDYIEDAKILNCPATQKQYHYMLNGQRMTEIKHPAKTIVFYEDFDNHKDLAVIAFIDGHVEQIKLNGAKSIEELAAAKDFIILNEKNNILNEKDNNDSRKR